MQTTTDTTAPTWGSVIAENTTWADVVEQTETWGKAIAPPLNDNTSEEKNQ